MQNYRGRESRKNWQYAKQRSWTFSQNLLIWRWSLLSDCSRNGKSGPRERAQDWESETKIFNSVYCAPNSISNGNTNIYIYINIYIFQKRSNMLGLIWTILYILKIEFCFINTLYQHPLTYVLRASLACCLIPSTWGSTHPAALPGVYWTLPF